MTWRWTLFLLIARTEPCSMAGANLNLPHIFLTEVLLDSFSSLLSLFRDAGQIVVELLVVSGLSPNHWQWVDRFSRLLDPPVHEATHRLIEPPVYVAPILNSPGLDRELDLGTCPLPPPRALPLSLISKPPDPQIPRQRFMAPTCRVPMGLTVYEAPISVGTSPNIFNFDDIVAHFLLYFIVVSFRCYRNCIVSQICI